MKDNLKNLQEQNSKYFTPNIEDIRVGYECEVESNSKWKHITVTAIDSEENSIGTDNGGYWLAAQNLRVPYLTKEQIEADGWDFGSSYILIANFAEEGKDEEIRIGIKNNYKLVYNFYTHKLKITEHNPDELVLFNRECKDINTFRLILKLLHINE